MKAVHQIGHCPIISIQCWQALRVHHRFKHFNLHTVSDLVQSPEGVRQLSLLECDLTGAQ